MSGDMNILAIVSGFSESKVCDFQPFGSTKKNSPSRKGYCFNMDLVCYIQVMLHLDKGSKVKNINFKNLVIVLMNLNSF